MTRDYWGQPYDGAPHPDKSRPEDHNEVSPIVWAEWQAARLAQAQRMVDRKRFVAAISLEGDNDDDD